MFNILGIQTVTECQSSSNPFLGAVRKLNHKTRLDLLNPAQTPNSKHLPRWAVLAMGDDERQEPNYYDDVLDFFEEISPASSTQQLPDDRQDSYSPTECLFFDSLEGERDDNNQQSPLNWSLEQLLESGFRHLHCLPGIAIQNMASIDVALELGLSISSFANVHQLTRLQKRAIATVALRNSKTLSGENCLLLNSVFPAKRILEGGEDVGNYNGGDTKNWSFLQRAALALANGHFDAFHRSLGNPFIAQSYSLAPPASLQKHFHQILFALYDGIEQQQQQPIRFSREQYSRLLTLFIRELSDPMEGNWLQVLICSENAQLKDFILGLKCSHLDFLGNSHIQIVALIELYNERRFQFKNREVKFPNELKGCLANMVKKYILDKARYSECNKNDTNFDVLNSSEIKALGGNVFLPLFYSSTSLKMTHTVRLQTLSEIAGLQLNDLLTDSVSYDQLGKMADLLWKELNLVSSDRRWCLSRMKNLFYFSSEVRNMMTEDNFHYLQTFPCLNDEDMTKWTATVSEEQQMAKYTGQLKYYYATPLFFQDHGLMQQFNRSQLFNTLTFLLSAAEERSHFGEPSIVEQCIKWLEIGGQESTLLQSRILEVSRYTIVGQQKQKQGKRRNKRSGSSNADYYSDLERSYEAVRANWKQLYRDNLLSEQQKSEARDTFQMYFRMSVEKQRGVLGLDDGISDEDVEYILEQRILDGSLTVQQEEELHLLSNELKMEFILEVETILGIQILHNAKNVTGVFDEYVRSSKTTTTPASASTFIRDFGELLDPEIGGSSSTAAGVAELSLPRSPFDNLLDRAFEQMEDNRDERRQQRKRKDPGDNPKQSLTVQSTDKQKQTWDQSIVDAMNKYGLGSGIQTWAKEGKANLNIAQLYQILEISSKYPGLSNNRTQVRVAQVWSRLKSQLSRQSFTYQPLHILSMMSAIPVLSRHDLDGLLSNPIQLLAKDWGHEVLLEISEHLDNVTAPEFIRPVLNCSLFPSARHWKLAIISVSPALCQIPKEEIRERVLSPDCPDISQDVYKILASNTLSSGKCHYNEQYFLAL